MKEILEVEILEYLNENRYFTEAGLKKKLEEIKDIIEDHIDNGIRFKKEFLEEREMEEKLKKLKIKFEEYINKKVFSLYFEKILMENFILLEYERKTNKIIILKEKEAEFFAFIFNFYKSECANDCISKKQVEEVKRFLDMEERVIEQLIKDEVLVKRDNEDFFRSLIPIQRRREIYQNSEIENKIFLKITSLNINKKFKKLKEEMKEAEERMKESNKKIEEAEKKIKESNKKIEEAEEKIDKTIKSIENTKVDTLALLAIFVAIISIIYGNISVSNAQSIKNIVITNVSTVACIAFILGYIEIFIKDNKIMKKGYFISTTMIIVALALIISAYYD